MLLNIELAGHLMSSNGVCRVFVLLAVVNSAAFAQLPGTRALDWDGDLASRMVDGVDRFLLREIADSVAGREEHWQRDFSSAGAYQASVATNRTRLKHILGLRDPRVEPVQMQLQT